MTNRWGLTIEERDADVLDALRDAGWVKPIDIGGQDCSHHSSTLNRLIKKGLVERKVWGGYTRLNYQYRLKGCTAAEM
jgi:hypothetical protein